MATTDNGPNQKLIEFLPRIMGFARLVQNLANRFKGIARFLALTGLASGLLLLWLATRAWGLSALWSVLLGGVLLLPGLVVGWSWYVLEEASNLPQRLTTWLGQAGQYAGDVVQRLQSDPATAPKASKFSDLKQLGGLAYEIASMGLDSRDLLSILGGSLSLTNPIFLLVLMIAVGLIVLLDMGALICGVFAVLT